MTENCTPGFDPNEPIGRFNMPMMSAPRGGVDYRQPVAVEPGDVRDMSPAAVDRRTRQTRRATGAICDGLADLFYSLERYHGFRSHRIGELIHDSGMIVGHRYAGNEFTLSLVNAPNHPAGFGTIPIRLTQVVIERDPDAIRTLGAIIGQVATGVVDYQVHLDAGMSLLGLECGNYLFGFRTPPAVDAQAVDGRVDTGGNGITIVDGAGRPIARPDFVGEPDPDRTMLD